MTSNKKQKKHYKPKNDQLDEKTAKNRYPVIYTGHSVKTTFQSQKVIDWTHRTIKKTFLAQKKLVHTAILLTFAKRRLNEYYFR